MKKVFLLLMAMFAIATTSAQGQEACSKSYVSCMDKCVSRPSESLQANCVEACQSQNNACFAKAYGAPNTGPQTVRQNPPQAGDAQAATPPAEATQVAVPPVEQDEQVAEEPRRQTKPTKTAKPAKSSERRTQ